MRQRRNGISNTSGGIPDDRVNFLESASKLANGSGRTRTLIVCPILKNHSTTSHSGGGVRDSESVVAEASSLAAAIDLEIIQSGSVVVSKPRPATMLGKGKLEDIRLAIAAGDIELVIFDGPLSPVQQRNLERQWKVKVLDRTGLILEIFGRRAKTAEGRLQVELAHLSYQRSRLVRSWTHLERQRGGYGFLGGPGETQIEADRRQISERITKIKKLLVKVQKTRALHRSNRQKVPYPIVALVGYTNAGKSTLFNRLTDANVVARDQLFATLDPTMRGVDLPSGRRVILSDTVGFISELPHELVAAFRATLEEVLEADIILHVRDIAHAESDIQSADVTEVLRTLGIETENRHDVLEAWNKIDLLDQEHRAVISNQAARHQNVTAISSTTGEGILHLIEMVEKFLEDGADTYRLKLAAAEGKALNWLYENCEIVERADDDCSGEIELQIRVSEFARRKVAKKFGARLHAV